MSANEPKLRPGQIHQIISCDKTPLPARRAAGAFIDNTPTHLATTNGPVFAEPTHGNKVHFFSTGQEYFSDVAKAIESASKSVFIAGWQVNFDVILNGNKRLIDCLDKALQNGASVYVMPWLSPKVGVDTNDLETMLAVYMLNAGRQGPPKAFCMPAIQQSDMGGLGIAFAHHQKLVVIDNKIAYVGGIDLAYGRRDDAKFALEADADGRKGCEMYNTCIPPIRQLWSEQQVGYLTLGELLAASAIPFLNAAATTPARITGSMRDSVTPQSVRDWWDSSNLLEDFAEWYRTSAANRLAGQAQGAAMDAAAAWAQSALPDALRKTLEELRQQGATHLSTMSGVLLAWLNGLNLQSIPVELREGFSALACALTMRLSVLLAECRGEQTRYAPLFNDKRTMLPPDGKTLDPKRQPRLPWQDVQARMEGAAVYDVAMNFIRRWNSVQISLKNEARFIETYGGTYQPEYRALLKTLGLDQASLKGMPIPNTLLPVRSKEKPGQATVQVLRSAPAKLRKAEKAAMPTLTQPAEGLENNCERAMLQAISGAQRFIYIEGQFFQSAHGDPAGFDPNIASGPLSALTKVYGLPGYARFKGPLNLETAMRSPSPALHIRWSGIPRVQSDPDFPAFIEGLKRMLGNKAMIEVTRRLGPVQASLENPICRALGERIEWAIRDGQPFHVYLVLPVHPEGTLDTLNIMNQVHHTMQSLVFGQHSLVNRVRRALYQRKQVKEMCMSPSAAAKMAAELDTEQLDKLVGDESWREYLTLLNLRNWTTLPSGRVVTEQIYIHSKLLIADDRLAVLGSANINDRSLLGSRDSELAIVVHDKAAVHKPLNGKDAEPVSAVVHTLRSDLWKKHFGLTGGVRPASSLAGCIDRPGDPATWKAIQEVAKDNADRYEAVFSFIPRNESLLEKRLPEDQKNPSAPLWPTWVYNNYRNYRKENDSLRAGGYLKQPMPFEAGFWEPEVKFSPPKGIQGFIVALPTGWTKLDNNDAGLNLSMLAHFDLHVPNERSQFAANAASASAEA